MNQEITIQEWPVGRTLPATFNGDFFSCLVWAYDSVAEEQRQALLEHLIKNGCRSVVCAGVDSQLWENDADFINLELEKEQPNLFVTTTTHKDETPVDIIFFLLNCTNFDNYEFKNHLILLVNPNTDSKKMVEEAIREYKHKDENQLW